MDYLTSPRRQGGYSLVDLMLVLGVVVMIAAAVLPSAADAVRTYRRDAAARELLAEVRSAQSLAVTRHDVYGLQWGADPSVKRSASSFRIVRDTTGSCGIPDADAPADGTNVIRDWTDVASQRAGMTIQSITDSKGQSVAGVMFDSLGASVNTCASVSFPVAVTLADGAGRTRVIEIRAAGATRLR